MKTSTTTGWIRAGVIGVDAGLCWIGDPCYILHRNGDERTEDIGSNWSEFCDKIADMQASQQIGDGLGVVVSTGYGDGVYPVFIKKNSEGRVTEAKVVFVDKDGE